MAQLGLAPSSKNIWGFDPRTVGSCVLWLDAADSNTVFSDISGTTPASSGETVAYWKDKSASGYNATQSTALNRPTWSSNGLTAASSSISLATSYTAVPSTETIFVVFTPSSSATNLLYSTAANGRSFFSNSLTLQTNKQLVGAVFQTGSILTFGTRSLAGTVYNGTNIVAYLNGTSITTGTANLPFSGTATSSIGLSNWNGIINEIVVYNSALSAQNRQSVEGYLAWKWGLQANLPSSHPFSSGIYSVNPVSSFNPTSISGNVLWLDAADSSAVFSDISGTTPATNGGTVAHWKDKSGQGYNATQSTAGNRPTWSSNGLVASNTTTSFATSYTAVPSSETIFVMFTPNSGGTTNLLYSTTLGSRSLFLNVLSLQTNKQLLGSVFQSGTVFSYSIRALAESVYNGTSITAYVNGTSVASGSASLPFSGAGTTNIGNWYGTINEIIVYNSALTTAQRQQVEGYLSWKWGIQANLLPSQPYSPTLQFVGRPLARYFNPVDVPGCALWMDAADASSVTLSGSNVSTIADKSGNGLNMTAGGTAPPYVINAKNGLNAVNFTTSNSYLSTSATNFDLGTSDFSFFAAGITASTSNGLYPIVSKNYGNTTNSWVFWRNNNSQFGVQTYSSSTLNLANSASASSSANTWYVASGIAIRGTSIIVYSNGTAGTTASMTASSNAAGSVAILIGGTSGTPWGNYLGEVIVYSGTITVAQCQQIEAYLAWKWGIRSSFATTYPLFSVPPNAVPFNPRSISGCVLWLDGADSNTIQFSSGTSVIKWNDKSGNVNHSTQITTANQPTYSNNGIVFSSASSQYLNMLSPSTLPNGATPTGTFFFVSKLTTGSAVQALFMYGPTTLATGANPQFYYNASNQLVLDTFGAGGTTDGTAVLNNTVIFSSTISNTGGTGTVTGWRNSNSFGPTTYTTASITSQKGFIGVTQTGVGTSGTNAYYFNGSIYEIVIYNSVLSTSRRQQVEGYLAWKWGLNANLPTTHAFYKIRP